MKYLMIICLRCTIILPQERWGEKIFTSEICFWNRLQYWYMYDYILNTLRKNHYWKQYSQLVGGEKEAAIFVKARIWIILNTVYDSISLKNKAEWQYKYQSVLIIDNANLVQLAVLLWRTKRLNGIECCRQLYSEYK